MASPAVRCRESKGFNMNCRECVHSGSAMFSGQRAAGHAREIAVTSYPSPPRRDDNIVMRDCPDCGKEYSPFSLHVCDVDRCWPEPVETEEAEHE